MNFLNITPIMTSDSTPSPYVMAASSYDEDYDPYKALDDSSTSFWMSSTEAGPREQKWIYLYLGEDYEAAVTYYTFSIGTNTAAGLSWRFEGSKDGMVWEVLHSDSKPASYWTEKYQTYDSGNIENSTIYRYYRIIEQSSDYIPKQISNIQLYVYDGSSSSSGLVTLNSYDFELSKTISEYNVEGRTQGYMMSVTVDNYGNAITDPNIFMYLMTYPDGETEEGNAVFQCIASPADLEEYPVGTPPETSPKFYRMASVNLVSRNISLLEEAWEDIKDDCDELSRSLEAFASLDLETVYVTNENT
jgi:hypothetical protein